MAKIKKKLKKVTEPNAGQNIVKLVFIQCWLECKMVYPLWKWVCQVLQKLDIQLLYNPALEVLDIYLEKWRSVFSKTKKMKQMYINVYISFNHNSLT